MDPSRLWAWISSSFCCLPLPNPTYRQRSHVFGSTRKPAGGRRKAFVLWPFKRERCSHYSGTSTSRKGPSSTNMLCTKFCTTSSKSKWKMCRSMRSSMPAGWVSLWFFSPITIVTPCLFCLQCMLVGLKTKEQYRRQFVKVMWDTSTDHESYNCHGGFWRRQVIAISVDENQNINQVFSSTDCQNSLERSPLRRGAKWIGRQPNGGKSAVEWTSNEPWASAAIFSCCHPRATHHWGHSHAGITLDQICRTHSSKGFQEFLQELQEKGNFFKNFLVFSQISWLFFVFMITISS